MVEIARRQALQMVEQPYTQIAEDALCHGGRQVAINEREALTQCHRPQVKQRQHEQAVALADRQMIVDDPADEHWRQQLEQGARQYQQRDNHEDAQPGAYQLGELMPKALACSGSGANRSDAHVSPFATAIPLHA